ncbi:hypothetical protein CB599_11645 [Salmonella enterica subsp. enterica serovar Adjame]|nr:hypothetical protein [Salmonella enterica subsp. enterica serovar Adjame]
MNKRKKVTAPDREFRNRVERRGDLWYWKNIPENIAANRDLDQPIGFSEKSTSKYLRFRDGEKYYSAHRVIYWLHTNEWPDYVDHKDRDTRNNLFSNLRAATAQQNVMNRSASNRTHNLRRRKLKDGSIRYYPEIKFGSKSHCVGAFNTELEAITASLFIRRLLHGEFFNPDLSMYE